MQSLNVTIVCNVLPTESPEKIKNAIRKVFGDVAFTDDERRIIAEGDKQAVESLINVIARERIAARAYFLFKARKKGDSIIFPLERDPLTVGKISFGEDSAVPPIWVEIRGNVDEVLERLRSIADNA
ncbi:MAG: hypothetical protein GXN93_02135 [Candidatus Diapherotrites archaeon]|nr:hypothetical protein [Candidatus Diapherotrites archaeon]